MRASRTALAVRLFAAMIFATLAAVGQAADYDVGLRQASFGDQSRPVKATNGFDGAPVRRIDVMIWYPAAKAVEGGKVEGSRDAPLAKGGPWPLVIYSHGTNGFPNNNMHMVNELVHHG